MNRDEQAKRWLFLMSESLPQEEFTTMIVTLWAIWAARRKAIHEGILQSPHATHIFVQRFISKLKAIKKVPNSIVCVAPARHPQRWKPPVAGMVKINVDGALSRDGATGASAAICRDDEGRFLGSSSMVFLEL